MSDPEFVEGESPDDEKAVFVVDPEDYQKTKRLESIHKARERVQKLREDKPITANASEWRGHHKKLNETVADYGSELMPVIEDALEGGALDEDDLHVEMNDEIHIVEYIWANGKVPNHQEEELEVGNPAEAMAVYRQLDRILRKLGLGLELKEDKGPAQI